MKNIRITIREYVADRFSQEVEVRIDDQLFTCETWAPIDDLGWFCLMTVGHDEDWV